MTTKQTFRRRRLKLAKFIRGLKPRVWDMKSFTTIHLCGTAHCMAGWCPTVFPKAWSEDVAGCPVLREHNRLYNPCGGFAVFFGISYNNAYDLITRFTATRKEIADALEAL